MTNTIPRVVSIREASRETGLSYHCISRWCQEGKIVSVKTGNKSVVNLDKLIEYLNTGKVS